MDDGDETMPDFGNWVDACFRLADDDPFRNGTQPSGQTLAEYLARLFESPAFLGTKYSRDQIAKGLWWICGCVSGFFHEAMDSSVTESAQRRWIRAISQLYADLLDPLCEQYPFHQVDDDPLCRAATMLWDMDSLEGATFRLELHDDCLQVLQSALDCQSAACVRSGLHGLGHWIGRAELQKDDLLVKRLRHRIDSFLKTRPELPRDLVEYARAARTDRIL